MARSGAVGGDWWKWALAGLAGILIGATFMLAASGHFVRSYILEHPEIIPEAIDRLEERQAAAAVERHREALETPFHGAWAGAEDGDVVMVEFFDYACGFCRAMNPVVERLIEEDPRLKVVWRELPVLGPGSREAAISSLAAAEAGRFKPFHRRLFELGRPSGDTVAEARQVAGIAEPEAKPEYERELGTNLDLAEALRVNGTPTFVIGDRIFRGAVGYEALKEGIAAARGR